LRPRKRLRDAVKPAQQAIWRVLRLASLPAPHGVRQRIDDAQFSPFGGAALGEMAEGAVSRAIDRPGLTGRAAEIDPAWAGVAAVDDK
jgi:hypothetical protein